jgi:hypothetical protein
MNDGGICIAKNFATRSGVSHVQASDFRDRDGTGVAGEQLDFIAGANFAFARDCQVETGAGGGEKALDHLVGLKTDAQFVARQARLRGNHFGGAHDEAVAEMHGIFQQAIRGEVFPEDAKGKIAAGQFLLPVGIVLDGVAVDGFVFTAMNLEVGLTVTIQIQLAKSDAARDRLLEDAGGDPGVVPGDFAGEADVDGDEPQGGVGLSERACMERMLGRTELDAGFEARIHGTFGV